MKKIQTLILLLFSIALCSCSLLYPMKPNNDTINDNMGPLLEDEISVSSSLASNNSSDTGTLEIDYFGLGTATIKATSVKLEKNWEATGISADNLSDEKKYYENGQILIINLLFNNINIDTSIYGVNENLVNSFYLVSKQQLDNPSPPSPMVEPVYYKQSENSGKRYFQFKVPIIEESTDITFGFQLSSSDFELLQKNELFIAYTTMGLEDASILPLIIDK